MRCDQETVRGDRCMREATWLGRDGERYCTQHANHYGIPRRGGERLDTSKRDGR